MNRLAAAALVALGVGAASAASAQSVSGAADGYHVVLALAETDPAMRPNRIILADRCNGAAMAAPEGPFRMVVEGDLRPARSARQVTSIAVVRLPTTP